MSRSRSWRIAGIVAVMLVVALWITWLSIRPPLIDVQGRQVEVRLRGDGSLAVIFELGAVGGHIAYWRVQNAVARHATTPDISGNCSEFARALGGYSERVTDPTQIAHAITNGIRATQEGKAVLLEFITTQDKVYSTFQGGYQGGH